MKTRLLKKIRDHILEEPRRLDMLRWGRRWGRDVTEVDKSLPPCGTVCCIAGWSIELSGKNIEHSHYPGRQATKLLGLTGAQASRLFYDQKWPRKFMRRLNSPTSTFTSRAKAAADRIDHFIATRGRE